MDPRHFAWENVSKLLGQPFKSPMLKKYLADSGIDAVTLWQEVPVGLVNERTTPPRDTAEIDLKDMCGVRMRFKLGGLLSGFEELRSEFIFSGITYYAEGEDSAKGYVGSMPFNLTFSDADPVLLAKVGGPPNTSGGSANGTYRFHRWSFENYILQVVFLSKTLMLRRVFAFLPLKEEGSEARRYEGASLRRL